MIKIGRWNLRRGEMFLCDSWHCALNLLTTIFKPTGLWPLRKIRKNWALIFHVTLFYFENVMFPDIFKALQNVSKNVRVILVILGLDHGSFCKLSAFIEDFLMVYNYKKCNFRWFMICFCSESIYFICIFTKTIYFCFAGNLNVVY